MEHKKKELKNKIEKRFSSCRFIVQAAFLRSYTAKIPQAIKKTNRDFLNCRQYKNQNMILRKFYDLLRHFTHEN